MGRKWGFHSGVGHMKECRVAGNMYIQDTLIFGDVSFGVLRVKGRMVTGSASGTAIDIDADYSYGQGHELRWTISSWSGSGNTFDGMYVRAQSDIANASGNIRGMQIYGVGNDVNTQGIWGMLVYAYVKGTTAKTVSYMYAIQPELTWDASANTCTLSTEAICVRARITGGKVDDYTKIHGYQLKAGDMNGASVTYGNAFHILDDSGMSGTVSWTVGLYLEAPCTTFIRFAHPGVANDHCLDVVDEYLGMFIETGSYSSGTTGIVLTSVNKRPVSFLFDDNGAAMTGDVRAVLSRVVVTANHTGSLTLDAMRGQIKFVGGVDYDADYVSGVRGYVEIAGTTDFNLNSADHAVSGLHSRIEVAGNVNLQAGYLAGVFIELNTTGAYTVTQTGILAGIVIEYTDQKNDAWGHGLYIADGAVDTGVTIGSSTTGIDIGDCTTGMVFTGTTNIVFDFDNITTGAVDITSGAATTIKAQILVKTPAGNTGYINVYGTTGT